jgi:hypothetical protein
LADRDGSVVEKHAFGRDRLWHNERAAYAALDLARRRLLKIPQARVHPFSADPGFRGGDKRI